MAYNRFDDIPDELLENIFRQNLSGKDLFSVSLVCRRFQHVVNTADDVWESACKQDRLWPPSLELGRRRKKMRKRSWERFVVYQQQEPESWRVYYGEAARKLQELRTAEYREAKEVQEKRQKRIRRKRFKVLEMYAVPGIAVLLLIAFLFLLPVKLEGIMTASWITVLSPLWAFFGLFFLWTIMGTFGKFCIDQWKKLWEPVLGWILITIMSSIVVFTVLVALRSAGYITTAWKLVFIPVFILLLFGVIVSFIYFFTSLFKRSAKFDSAIALYLTLALTGLATSAFLHAYKLDGEISASWTTTLIPLWVTYGSPVSFIVVFWLRKHNRARRLEALPLVGAVYALEACPFATSLLLAMKADGTYGSSYLVCWIPIYIMGSMSAIATVIVVLVKTCRVK